MKNKIFFYIVILFFSSVLFVKYIYSSEMPIRENEDDWKNMLTSDIEKNRHSAQKIILEQREDTIKYLISVLNSPLQENEEFYNSNTSRNIAILLLGKYRSTEAVPDLIKWLLPKAGQNMIIDELSFFSPAGNSLIEIGLPSVPPLIKLLKSNTDNSLLEQYVKIIVAIKGLPETELLFESEIKKEKDNKKIENMKKAFDFMKDPKNRNTLERIDELFPK